MIPIMPYRGRGVHQFRGRGAGGLPRGCRSREQFKCRVHQEFIQMEQEYCRKLQITIDVFCSYFIGYRILMFLY